MCSKALHSTLAQSYNKIETDPIMDASMPKLSNSRMLSISHDDYLLLLECAGEHIKSVLTMAYYEPMRKDEIIRLVWKEVDIKAGFIRLEASRTKGGIEGRSIPIHPEVRKMLSKLPRSFQFSRVFYAKSMDSLNSFMISENLGSLQGKRQDWTILCFMTSGMLQYPILFFFISPFHSW